MEKSQQSFLSGVLFTIGSAASLSLLGLLGDVGLKKIPLIETIFWRYTISFFLALFLTKMLGQLSKHALSKSLIKQSVLRAFLVLGSQYSFFYSIEKMNLLNATVFLNTGPLFIPFLQWIIFHKRPGTSTWISLSISFLGVLCILQPFPLTASIFSSWWSLIGLFSGLCQAGSQIIFGANSKSEKSEFAVLHLFFLCSLFSAIPYIVLSSSSLTLSFNPSYLWLFLGIGVTSVANQSLRAEAYKHSTPSRLAPFLYFSVVLAGLWDWLFFGNLPNHLAIVGIVLVVLGGGLKIHLRSRKIQKKKNQSN